MLHVQEITNDMRLIGLRKPEPAREVGGARWMTWLMWSAGWGCGPCLMDGSVKWQTHGRKIASCDGSVSILAGDKGPVNASIIKQYRHR